VKLIFVNNYQYFEVETLRVNVSSVVKTLGSVKYNVCMKNYSYQGNVKSEGNDLSQIKFLLVHWV